MCFARQYENFNNKDLHKPLTFDGTRYADEITCDNVGLRAAYSAFQKLMKEKGEEKTLSGLGLNSEKVFFLSYAQAWCVNYRQPTLVNHYYKTGKHPAARFRIVGTLRNAPEFAKVFNCPLGSPMNPEEKCSRIYGSG
ncbi:endothelin-converting enzyme 1 [Elysia marginata]|uniref:Endothelin-converting enzyme 1 n=1 Tax=Elysia marginata TaxID=1093978 RepID=A0AAV4HA67_9GAST|nr:endothelin-converting enzyme 1 [Elysia marginata]